MDTNVTLISVLLLVFLYIPGHLFKRFYFKGPFVQQFGIGVFAERFITSIFWGIVMQILALLVTKQFIDISYNNLKQPIADFYSKLCENKIPDLDFENIANIGVYLFVAILVSIIMGFVCHTIVRVLGLDIIVTALRFHNQWHYYFKGESIGGYDKSKFGKVLSTEMDVLTNDGNGGTKLYSGFLKEYTLSNKTGELSTITLAASSRYSSTQKKFVSIPGDCLIIPFEKVINLNLRFNRVEKLPFGKRVITYLVLIITLTELFAIFFIPIKFYALGSFKIIMSVILSILSMFSLQIALFSPFMNIENSTKKSQTIIVIFFSVITLILLVGLLSFLNLI